MTVNNRVRVCRSLLPTRAYCNVSGSNGGKSSTIKESGCIVVTRSCPTFITAEGIAIESLPCELIRLVRRYNTRVSLKTV